MSEDHLPLDEQIEDARAIAPDRIAAARQELGQLVRALDGIGPVARDAFVLVRVEGYSHKEAARKLHITPKAVSHHIERTLARLAGGLLEAER